MSLPEPRPGVAALTGYHSPQVDVAVRLNTNESPFPPPEGFLEAVAGAVRATGWHRYPDREQAALRAGLGAYLNQPPGRLYCANGSNEVLQSVLLAYGGAGREAVVFEPSYVLHAHIARITDTGVVALGRRPGTFALELDAATAAITERRPAVVFLTTPNNPTGVVEDRASVEALLEATERAGGLLVVDEAYAEFSSWTALDLVGDDRPLLVTRTYSKVWSMAAARLGFAVASEAVVEVLERVGLPYRLSALTQAAGTEALRFTGEMDGRVAAIVSERERLTAALSGVDDVTVYPSGANFVLIRPVPDGHAVWRALLDKGVLVRDFSRWPGLEGCLRVTIGRPEENDAFLTALKEALA